MSAAKARLERVVGHRVAAVLDHDDLAVQLLEPGQRLGEHLAALVACDLGGGHELYAEFSST